ncbi:polysulfide reductase NrfD [Candidatus Halobeggiatoa sp. HSG11]|nr:polysulfide reductase NrfD [Candidatus Halobeggiatoa sp. HSG11]
MKNVTYRIISGKRHADYIVFATSIFLVLFGLFAAYKMEHNGHIITGMNNQIVWGLPHVFAIFLILAASGILNVASISSVFQKTFYHPHARLSALLAITLLIGGLTVLVLDLGRPDRLIIAMTNFNFKSIFVWNIFLYNGFLLICVLYLWFMMEKKMQRYYSKVGLVAFLWRLILTTGTGSIFGFLVAREAYHTAIMAPLFISLSLSLGLAIFLLVLIMQFRSLGEAILHRPKILLAIFISTVFYFVLAYHLSHLYFTSRHGIEYFLLGNGGGIYSILFWGGYFFLGTILPLLLLYHQRFTNNRISVIVACLLTILGGFMLLYVLIIGGQAYPLDIFAGKEVMSSTFFDEVSRHSYIPSIWEALLGMGGIGLSALLTLLALKMFPFVPQSLATSEIDPKFL